MGIQDLQSFLEGGSVPESCVGVDLVRISRSISTRLSKQSQKRGSNTLSKFSVVVDGECCLDRLYGGYFSDWACGGQWNRMVAFLVEFVNSLQKSNIDLVVFFNGCTEPQRMEEWIMLQQKTRLKVNQVLKHITTKGTPPPKVWWTSPVCLRTALRMVLRHLQVSVVCTMDDHKQEVIAYCRENNFHGLIADDAEYAAFDPPRYFSARQLKLTYKGSLESKEYILSELIKGLAITPDRLCILAALLGNYILPENDLGDVYKKAGIIQPPGKIPVEELVKGIANLVKNLPSVDNLDTTAEFILGSASDPRVAKLKQSIQYYLDGTKDGFLKYRPATKGKVGNNKFGKNKDFDKNAGVSSQDELLLEEPDLDTSKFASETPESELSSLQKYNEATASLTNPDIVINEPKIKDIQELDSAASDIPPLVTINGRHNNLLISTSSSSSSSNATSPARITPETKKSKPKSVDKTSKIPLVLPPVPPEVMCTVSERHNKGLMSPFINQILTQGEIKLPVVMEDENHKEIPSIHHFYRPIRQMVYAILFNLHHHSYMATKNKEKGEVKPPPDVKIREWVWTKSNPYQKPDIVKAEQIGWGVPTIQRLWFGTTIDDKRRRLRAYLTCMRSDNPLMLNPDYVPQHLLIMATVLRYMMIFPDKKVLRKPELDAFITTAIMPELMNTEHNQELQLSVVSSRGVQLATLFMQGVETALLVNDACGAPVPWLMCCPWLFFDGKLFHHQLARTATVKNIMELCDHRIRMVMKVERMRQAVLEGLNVQFARPPLPVTNYLGPRGIPNIVPPTIIPSGLVGNPAHQAPARNLPIGRGALAHRGLPRRNIPTNSGGRLEIAGVVVGSWGPNYGLTPPIGVGRSVLIPPQVTSVGGMGGYGGGNSVFRGSGRPSFNTRGGNTMKNKGRGFKMQQMTSKKRIVPGPGRKESIKRGPKGRGATVINPSTGIPGSNLMNGGSGDAKLDVFEESQCGQFEDAEIFKDTLTGLNGEGDAKMGVQEILAAAAALKSDN
uniref:Constitutive coactivator of PPAR-gamma-like protein 1 homolog n=1 Tax=Clastoptera arizonana TaxID=38151 RepID=A0A1B6BZX8_9HEMI